MIHKNKKIEVNSGLLNENIPFSRLLIINEAKEKEVISNQEALKRAKEAGLDLFCVAPQASPPVCKLINYQKYLFELNKKQKKKKENTNKEMGFSLNIAENDLKVKLEKVRRWLENDLIVKVILTMTGKEKIHPEVAREKCQKIIEKMKNQSPKFDLKDNLRQLPGSFWFLLYKKK